MQLLKDNTLDLEITSEQITTTHSTDPSTCSASKKQNITLSKVSAAASGTSAGVSEPSFSMRAAADQQQREGNCSEISLPSGIWPINRPRQEEEQKIADIPLNYVNQERDASSTDDKVEPNCRIQESVGGITPDCRTPLPNSEVASNASKETLRPSNRQYKTFDNEGRELIIDARSIEMLISGKSALGGEWDQAGSEGGNTERYTKLKETKHEDNMERDTRISAAGSKQQKPHSVTEVNVGSDNVSVASDETYTTSTINLQPEHLGKGKL